MVYLKFEIEDAVAKCEFPIYKIYKTYDESFGSVTFQLRFMIYSQKSQLMIFVSTYAQIYIYGCNESDISKSSHAVTIFVY